MLRAVWSDRAKGTAREKEEREGDREHSDSGVKAGKHSTDQRLWILFRLKQLLVVMHKNKHLRSSFISRPQIIFQVQVPPTSFVLEQQQCPRDASLEMFRPLPTCHLRLLNGGPLRRLPRHPPTPQPARASLWTELCPLQIPMVKSSLQDPRM